MNKSGSTTDPYLTIDQCGESLKRILADLKQLVGLVEDVLTNYSIHKEGDRENAELLYQCLPDHVKARVPATKDLYLVIAQAGITLQDYNARAPQALFDSLPEND